MIFSIFSSSDAFVQFKYWQTLIEVQQEKGKTKVPKVLSVFQTHVFFQIFGAVYVPFKVNRV